MDVLVNKDGLVVGDVDEVAAFFGNDADDHVELEAGFGRVDELRGAVFHLLLLFYWSFRYNIGGS